MGDYDHLHRGLYSAAFAARLVGLPVSTVRRWVGTSEALAGRGAVARANETELDLVSFHDLVEMEMIRWLIRERALSYRQLRPWLREAAEITGVAHPLAKKTVLMDGRKLFVEMAKNTGGDSTRVLELGSEGQLAFARVIKERAQQLVFNEGGVACQWFPLGRDRSVVVDPEVRFGEPVVLGTRVPVLNLVEFHRAEGSDVGRTATLMRLDEGAVRDALEYEIRLAA